MGTDDVFDILLLLFVLAILTPIMITNSIPLFKGSIGGFDTLIEKTAQKTEQEIVPVENTITKEDLLLMTVIADKSSLEPAVIQFSIDSNGDNIVNDSYNLQYDELSNEITIDEIINNKVMVQNTIEDYVPNNMELKLCTLVGANGIKKWVVFRK